MTHVVPRVSTNSGVAVSILTSLKEVPSMNAWMLIYFNSCACDPRDRKHALAKRINILMLWALIVRLTPSAIWRMSRVEAVIAG